MNLSEPVGVVCFVGAHMIYILYIFTTLEFPTHNFHFHLLTTSVNAKYYC